MSPTNDGSSARAQEIQGVLDECVDRLAGGQSITHDQVIAAHPDLMPELGDELRKLSLIERAQRRAREAGSSSGIASTVEGDATPWVKDANTIPGYRIVRELHRGGQGIVYEAFQESTRRKVAVKVMKEGPFAGPADEARFEREVQVLGQLRHPNIVAIHESGSSAGHHYFAMDYVPGQPLDAYMATTQPSMDKTLRLFAKVCEAVNAAHLRGVIHRDLKPGNIRIDTDGEPRILDFGLAKVAVPDVWHSGPPLSVQPGAAGPQPMTMTGQFLGSLPWASPEQAEAVPSKIDVRTDVYSLGVVLYHMLTGKFPYDVLGNMRDVIDNILTVEPLRPSTIRGNGGRLARRINDEIETIVLKCLQKERDRRYQTAGELARDVNHYLNGEPIEAKRDSLAYVLRKQLKRYRLPAAIAASFVVLITAGLVVSVTFWQQAGAERDEARTQAAIAEAVNEFLNEDLLAQASPNKEPDRDIKLRDVLDRTAERVEGRFEEQPLVEAAIRTTLGETYYSLGEYGAAQPHLERALEIRERVLGDEHPDTLSALTSLATLCAEQDRFEEAEALYNRALLICRRVLGDEHSHTLTAIGGLAFVHQRQAHFQQAESLFTEALDIEKRVLGEEDPGTLLTMTNLAALCRSQGLYDKAERLSMETLAIQKRVLGAEHPDTLTSLNNLATLYLSQGRHEDAEPLLKEALEVSRRVLGEEHPQTLSVVNNLACLYFEQGRPNEAERLLAPTLEILDRVLGEEHKYTLVVGSGLATAYVIQGRYDAAQPLLIKTLDTQRRVLGEEHPDTLSTMNNLAGLYANWGRYSEAESVMIDCLEINRRAHGEEHPETLSAMTNLAGLYLYQRRYHEAEALLVEALAAQRTVLGDEHRLTLFSMNSLAQSLDAQSKLARAEPLYCEALETQRRVLGDEHPDTLKAMNDLAVFYGRQGQDDKGEALLIAALESARRVLGEEHPFSLRTASNLAELRLEQAKYDEAEAEFVNTLGAQRRVVGAKHPDTLRTMTGLGALLNERSRFDEAEPLLRECLKTRGESLPNGDGRMLETMSLLGEALAGQEKFAEAEPLLIEGYEQMNPPPGKASHKQEALERIIKLYEAWDKPDQAAEWRAKLPAGSEAARDETAHEPDTP